MSFQALEITLIELCRTQLLAKRTAACMRERVTNLAQHNHHRSCLLDFDDELLVQVASNPANCDSRPLLDDRPFVVEETGAIEVRKVIQHVLIRHPELAVVTELVVEFLEPIEHGSLSVSAM